MRCACVVLVLIDWFLDAIIIFGSIVLKSLVPWNVHRKGRGYMFNHRRGIILCRSHLGLRHGIELLSTNEKRVMHHEGFSFLTFFRGCGR